MLDRRMLQRRPQVTAGSLVAPSRQRELSADGQRLLLRICLQMDFEQSD